MRESEFEPTTVSRSALLTALFGVSPAPTMRACTSVKPSKREKKSKHENKPPAPPAAPLVAVLFLVAALLIMPTNPEAVLMLNYLVP